MTDNRSQAGHLRAISSDVSEACRPSATEAKLFGLGGDVERRAGAAQEPATSSSERP
jgi:hypothetical protein